MGKGRKRKITKETEAEDWCFLCKDGGDLMICEYGDCLKVYHAECVGRNDSDGETEVKWTCDCHHCFVCHKASRFNCLCCPNSVCGKRACFAEFAHVKGKNGFCRECLGLVLLAEENRECDSDGETVDFKDRDTYECLFKEYWDIIKENEGYTLKDVYEADTKLKKGESYKKSLNDIGFDEYKEDEYKEDEYKKDSSSADSDEDDSRKYSPVVRKRKPKVQKFIGWGSQSLIEFLNSVGIDSTKELSQYDVDSVISKYIHEKNLIHPKQKRKVVCDEKLFALFRRKTVSKRLIYDLLESHFANNIDNLDLQTDNHIIMRKENGISTKEKEAQETFLFDKKPQKKKTSPIEDRKSCFAAIVCDNIKLVYLRRSLVEELLKQPESFESKLMGSFVKVKPGSKEYFSRNIFQLLPVTGLKKSLTGEIDSHVLLQVCHMGINIPISKLSDSDITEEDCEDLKENIKTGLIQRPLITEIQEKAQILHEDITKQWIELELVSLQNGIDRANEKGWRREFYQYMEQRELLKQESEQERLLKQAPKVMADVIELNSEPANSLTSSEHENADSPE